MFRVTDLQPKWPW